MEYGNSSWGSYGRSYIILHSHAQREKQLPTFLTSGLASQTASWNQCHISLIWLNFKEDNGHWRGRAQRVLVSAAKPSRHGRRKLETPPSCLLTSTHRPWHATKSKTRQEGPHIQKYWCWHTPARFPSLERKKKPDFPAARAKSPLNCWWDGENIKAQTI